MLPVRAAQCVNPHLGQAQRADLALFLETRHFTHGFLDGHALVPAVQVVQVDHVRAQALQAVLAVLAQGSGVAVDHAAHHAVIAAHARHAALAGQGDVVAVGLEHGADQRLAGAKPVECGGVEQGHARLQRGVQHGMGLLGGDGVAIGMAEIHAAQGYVGHGKGADSAFFHDSFGAECKSPPLRVQLAGQWAINPGR
ncbi:hypothetical protein D3C72_1602100 [compost metagenome]